MKSIAMYSVCFKAKVSKKAVDGSKKVEFISFGFPFYAEDKEQAKRIAVKSYRKKLDELAEDDLKPDPKEFDLWKLAVWVPEDPTPLRRCQHFVSNLNDLLEGGKYES